jgi:hypothetical protein
MNDLPPIRIVIAGGRTCADEVHVQNEMDYFIAGWMDVTRDRIEVVSGGAPGVDSYGEKWYNARFGKMATVMRPEYDRYHPSQAPLRRNDAMAKYAAEGAGYGVLCAFWDGQSNGTKYMINTALRHGLEVHVYRYEND